MTEYRDFADEWQGEQSVSNNKIESILHNIECTLRDAVTALRVIARALILLVLFEFLHYIL